MLVCLVHAVSLLDLLLDRFSVSVEELSLKEPDGVFLLIKVSAQLSILNRQDFSVKLLG